ncbi:MAG: hypothetical protein Q9208_007569 [Pyrenodesmia sp. 3 TL-2023]
MASPAVNPKLERFKKLLFLCIGDDEISEQGIESLRVYLEESCPIYEQKIDACRQFVAQAIPKIPESMLKDFTTRYADVLEELDDDEELRDTNLGDFVHEIRRCYPGKSAEVCRSVMNHVLKSRNQDTETHLPGPKVDYNALPSSASATTSIQYPQAVSEEGEIPTTSTQTRRQPEITIQADPALHDDDTMSQNFSTISLHNHPPNLDGNTNIADPRMRSQSLTRHRRQAEDWVNSTMPAAISPAKPKVRGASKTGQPELTQAYAARPQATTQGSLGLSKPSDDLSAFAVNPYIPRPGQLFVGGGYQNQNAKAPFGSFRDCPPLSNTTRASKTKPLVSRATPRPMHAQDNNSKGTKDANITAFGSQHKEVVDTPTTHREDSKTSQSGPVKSLATTDRTDIQAISTTQASIPIQDAGISPYSLSDDRVKTPLLKEEPNDDVPMLGTLQRDTATRNTRKRSNDDEADGPKKQKWQEESTANTRFPTKSTMT